MSVNHTVIVNFKERGFGCRKNCDYCTWRGNPMLPYGLQDLQKIEQFIQSCDKDFVTISGGAEPLYQWPKYKDDFVKLSKLIRANGFKVRVITREVQFVQHIKDYVDYVSISLDNEVMSDIEKYKDTLKDIDIEYSMVLPPLPTKELESLKPQYFKLFSKLGKRLILRENLNSIYPLDYSKLSFDTKWVAVVPRDLCMSSKYFVTEEVTGYDIIEDNIKLFNILLSHDDIYLFGGAGKHVISPKDVLEFTDIDVLATKESTITELAGDDYLITETTSTLKSYPRYFMLKSKKKAACSIQVILMNNRCDIETFVYNSQYSIDQFFIHQNKVYSNSPISKIKYELHAKLLIRTNPIRDLDLFCNTRILVENKYLAKMIKRGFKESNK